MSLIEWFVPKLPGFDPCLRAIRNPKFSSQLVGGKLTTSGSCKEPCSPTNFNLDSTPAVGGFFFWSPDWVWNFNLDIFAENTRFIQFKTYPRNIKFTRCNFSVILSEGSLGTTTKINTSTTSKVEHAVARCSHNRLAFKMEEYKEYYGFLNCSATGNTVDRDFTIDWLIMG